MRIRVNGKEHTCEEGVTVGALLGQLGLPRDGVAVAVDRQVIPRGEHARHRLHEGDEVEVIRAVGGG